MAQLLDTHEIESFNIELAELGYSLRSSEHVSESSSPEHGLDDEETRLQWAALERLPTFKRITTALFSQQPNTSSDAKAKRIVDVATLGAQERHVFIEKLIKHIEHDNLRLLKKLGKRIHKVGVQVPTVEVRYKNLWVEAECKVVHGRTLPNLWNTVKTVFFEIVNTICSKHEAKINILKDVNGVIKPRRMTLLLGPPGCGKTTFLLALSGKLNHSLKIKGDISYNGYKLQEFIPQKTSAYISQNDMHIPDMTVREIVDFSAQCQGTGTRAEILKEVSRREKQAGIVPDIDVDAYMKAISIQGLKSNLQTDYILKILGLDFCADTMVGDAMKRGISGGQKKRLTTGEMIVGPAKALFMDEISNGLDSSTAFQIVSCLQHLVHITDATALISLLQPAPETFDLFDDVILMAEGKIVYHGPRLSVCKFFEDCGFMCPERKGVADFLQEVISRKDQGQYWYRADEPYSYFSVNQFVKKFNESQLGKELNEELSKPLEKSENHKSALSFRKYSLPMLDMFKACARREFLLMKRNSFIYVFKTGQLVILSAFAMTVLLGSRLSVDVLHANDYLGAMFFALILLLVDGFPELPMTVTRLAVFHKQKELCFYPAWAYAIPATILKIPVSFLEAFVWTSLTYYVIGFSPEAGRFFRQFLLLSMVHLTSTSMFRLIASVCQTMVASTTVGSLFIIANLLFGGFILPKPSMPAWLDWGFWIIPLTYGEIGLSVNEFLAPRWQKIASANTTIGQQTLENRGLSFDGSFYWLSIGVLIGLTVLFNTGFTLALTFLRPPGISRAIISYEKYNQLQEKVDDNTEKDRRVSNTHLISTPGPKKGGMVLPFEPLTITFQDLQYYVDVPLEMRKQGFAQKKLQLLYDITGSFRPGILTALMGVSGAGKTTLMDVLCGRKTGGTIEGDIRIGGYPKVQDVFARISGYVEQTDIHSPQITVEESLVYSAWLRLPAEIDMKTKSDFVNEVLETIELDGIKDSLVGLQEISGLSNEQRKRLTIAVELVSNPSIIFMDEPTTGLDARAAAIVMRAVKNVVETGRTVVCTIHQPSIDIFEAFDELVLLKIGGRMIYSGPLGQHSRRVIEYFENVGGVPKIKDNYNPATWMLDITSKSAETELGADFAQIYEESTLYKENRELVKQLSSPAHGSKELHFPTRYPQNGWEQFRACLWKHHLSYWRSPSYNLTRILYMIAASILFGALFWQRGQKIDSQQDLFIMLGSMYTSIIFFGINSCSSVLSYVSTERTVLYRERFAGMYSPWAYAFAQVMVELPYLFVVALIYVGITYPMIGYSISLYKIFWAFYTLFYTLLCYTYMGMMLVSLTPSVQVASIIASPTYSMLILFAGYIVPRPRIPKWWIWLYYMCPTSWILNGMLTSQYGDVEKEILVFGETKTVSAFLQDYFGYHHDFLGVVAVVLIIYPFIFASLFAYFIGKLNYQKR
ncbi:pleiotropic drug resistance protein 3-like [Mercurialis annua]|uniref:pleiotropic drug resistance protein 3-like n=1 Tax=Mercurialis annua TaxID=3986 RepID=UPI00216109C0|nr:pleiotropic drug resistance protein 3-like [Mercurialis annua]